MDHSQLPNGLQSDSITASVNSSNGIIKRRPDALYLLQGQSAGCSDQPAVAIKGTFISKKPEENESTEPGGGGLMSWLLSGGNNVTAGLKFDVPQEHKAVERKEVLSFFNGLNLKFASPKKQQKNC